MATVKCMFKGSAPSIAGAGSSPDKARAAVKEGGSALA